jgi:hypothetical protein
MIDESRIYRVFEFTEWVTEYLTDQSLAAL